MCVFLIFPTQCIHCADAFSELDYRELQVRREREREIKFTFELHANRWMCLVKGNTINFDLEKKETSEGESTALEEDCCRCCC